MGNIGKQKKHQQEQMQYKLSKIARFVDETEIKTKQDVAFLNGLEKALSIMENRQAVYQFYQKPSIFKRIQSVYALIKSLFVKGSK